MSLDGFQSIKKYKGDFDFINTKYFNSEEIISTQITADQIDTQIINSEGPVIIDVNSTAALDVRRNDDGDSILLVDTTNSRVDIAGDLSVVGAFTYTDQNIFNQVDNIGILGATNADDVVDLGLLWKCSAGYTGLYRDANNKQFHLIKNVVNDPVTSIGAFDYANLNLNDVKINDLYFDTTKVTSGGNQEITFDFDADHGYIEFFTSNEGSRSGYFGYPTSLSNNLTIHNERTTGDIRLIAANGNILLNGSNVVSDISTNASNISTNTSNIGTNASNISLNTTDISTNTNNISTNSSNISTNATDISTNSSNITGKLNKSGDTMTGDLDMSGNCLTNVSNINTNSTLTINKNDDGTTPYLRFVDAGGYMYIQGGNATSGNHYLRCTAINGGLLNLFRIDTNQVYASSGGSVFTNNTMNAYQNLYKVTSSANSNDANQASLLTTTYAGDLGFESGYDANTGTNRYARLINTTPYDLEIECPVVGIQQIGISTISPLSSIHIQSSDLSVETGDLNAESSIVLEASDAGLELFSSSAGSYGSFISLYEMSGGAKSNSFSIIRGTGDNGILYVKKQTVNDSSIIGSNCLEIDEEGCVAPAYRLSNQVKLLSHSSPMFYLAPPSASYRALQLADANGLETNFAKYQVPENMVLSRIQIGTDHGSAHWIKVKMVIYESDGTTVRESSVNLLDAGGSTEFDLIPDTLTHHQLGVEYSLTRGEILYFTAKNEFTGPECGMRFLFYQSETGLL